MKFLFKLIIAIGSLAFIIIRLLFEMITSYGDNVDGYDGDPLVMYSPSSTLYAELRENGKL